MCVSRRILPSVLEPVKLIGHFSCPLCPIVNVVRITFMRFKYSYVFGTICRWYLRTRNTISHYRKSENSGTCCTITSDLMRHIEGCYPSVAKADRGFVLVEKPTRRRRSDVRDKSIDRADISNLLPVLERQYHVEILFYPYEAFWVSFILYIDRPLIHSIHRVFQSTLTVSNSGHLHIAHSPVSVCWTILPISCFKYSETQFC